MLPSIREEIRLLPGNSTPVQNMFAAVVNFPVFSGKADGLSTKPSYLFVVYASLETCKELLNEEFEES